MWFSHCKTAFFKVADYSEMVKWLENDLEVWGVEKASYSLVDLRRFVDNGTLVEKKGKGEKEDVSEGSGKQNKKKVIDKDVGRKGTPDCVTCISDSDGYIVLPCEFATYHQDSVGFGKPAYHCCILRSKCVSRFFLQSL